MSAAAKEFVRSVLPATGFITIVAIDPTRSRNNVRGMAVSRADPHRVDAFIDRHAGWNFYWGPNPSATLIDKKLTKKDVTSLDWLHVDVDDPSEAACERLRAYRIPPTLIIFSGGGWWAFWRLDQPVAVNKSNVESLEAYNKQLANDLGGDNCHNVDRIARLPGTTNWPTKTKIAKGRNGPVDAYVVQHHTERVYPLTAFAPDRSRDLMAKAASAVRSGKSPAAIQKELADHPHATNQRDPVRAVGRAVEKAVNDQDSLIETINAEHALIWVEGKLLVAWRNIRSGVMPRLSTVEDVKRRWLPYKLGKVNPIDLWMEDKRRAEYSGIEFQPGVEGETGFYNLWQGFSVEPLRGDCSLFLAHLRDIVCAGDDSLYAYVVQWLANLVQQPRRKPGTALAMGSAPGTGKGQVFLYLKPIFGPHALPLTGSEQLLSRFNDFLAGTLLVWADEAAWPGDKRGLERLKSYITEERLSVERKHVAQFEVDNYARFMIATNRDHAAPAEVDDRRYVMLPVANHRRDATAYWEALVHERSNGGPAALLHYLLNEVQLTLNLRITPKTTALAEQKLLGLDHVGQFWREMLFSDENELWEGYGDNRMQVAAFKFGTVVPTKVLHDFFLDFTKRHRISYGASLDSLGRALRRYMPEVARREARATEQRQHNLPARTMVYTLPVLAEARRAFCTALGGDVDWGAAPATDEDLGL